MRAWIFLLPFLAACWTRPTPLLLDTDPALGIFKNGKPRDIDDGLAIIEALNHKKLHLLGVTVVFGNSEVKQGLDVARKLIELKKARVPVVRGAADKESAPDQPATNPAVEFLASKLRGRKTTIAAIGPLTNIAALIKNYPRESRNIKEVVAVMGRSPGQHFYIGERGPVRDFNFVQDAAAAKTVMNSDVPIVLAPFELSVQAVVTAEHLKTIRNHGTESSEFLYKRSQAWLAFWRGHFPSDRGFHPWDSAAIAYLTHPDTLICEKRGFRFRKVADKAHGVSHKSTGKRTTMQTWFELSPNFAGKKIKYCYGFQPAAKDEFVRRIIQNVY